MAGDSVTVTVGGSSYTTTVNADGSTWSVGVPGSVLAANGQVEASVTTLDDAGNPNTASTDRAYSVDTTLPAAGISSTRSPAMTCSTPPKRRAASPQRYRQRRRQGR